MLPPGQLISVPRFLENRVQRLLVLLCDFNELLGVVVGVDAAHHQRQEVTVDLDTGVFPDK